MQIEISRDEYLAEITPLLEQTIDNTGNFARAFLPHRFDRQFDEPHYEIFKLIDDKTKKRVAIAAPRGTGKTSLDTIAYPAKEICYQFVKHIVIISATHAKAAEDVDNLAKELTENPNITKVFGNLKGPRWSTGTGRITTSTGVDVVARGAGQQIRGLLKESRPDLIIIDDLEDPEPFRIGGADEYLRKLKIWFYADLLNSIDMHKTRVVFLGTVLGQAALLQELIESPDWDTVRLELCDDNYETNYPNYMSSAEVKELAARFKRAGQLDLFYQEFRNLTIAGEDASFQEKYFHPYDPAEVAKDYLMEAAVIVDPAKKVAVHTDYTGIVGVGFCPEQRRIRVLDVVNEKLHPDEIYTAAWKMAMKLRTFTIGVEVTSLNEFITYPFNTFLRIKGFPDVVELKARGKKEERIKALAPFYKAGMIEHNPTDNVCTPLESQLLAFPKGKHDDVADAMAYSLELFDAHERFFMMPDDEDQEALEKEMEWLYEQDKQQGQLENWRVA